MCDGGGFLKGQLPVDKKLAGGVHVPAVLLPAFNEDFGLELDEEKLTDAIIRLIDDKVLRQKLSENAIKNYREKFTLDNMIENTINVYEQLIQQDNA